MPINKAYLPIYYETLSKNSMVTYPFFIDKLISIQNVADIIRPTKNEISSYQSIINGCKKCGKLKFYRLGNIVWPSNLVHLLDKHQLYPSEYFIKIILNTAIINDVLVNPPLQLTYELIPLFKYIPLDHNKLLIMDALMKQGSYPRYENKNKFIYSEHSGVISVKNGTIDNIIIFAASNRMDYGDENIYLPLNNPMMEKYEYLFHTHPNTQTYGGRIDEGIIYEFPSANDIFNFVKYHNIGIVQASIIISPEGAYIIRPIKYQNQYNIDSKFYYFLKKYILKLEKKAMTKFADIISDIADADIFYNNISYDFKFIELYNKYLEPHNLFIEYYPRIKKNGEWMLRPMGLPFINLT